MTVPRGIRNNNPGNIKHSNDFTWKGEIGCDGPFCVFDTPENGIRAMAKLLHTYQIKYGLRTVRHIVSRWAPPTENDTKAYIAAVAGAMRVDPDVDIDLDDLAFLGSMVAAFTMQENGEQPYDSLALLEGAQDAVRSA